MATPEWDRPERYRQPTTNRPAAGKYPGCTALPFSPGAAHMPLDPYLSRHTPVGHAVFCADRFALDKAPLPEGHARQTWL